MKKEEVINSICASKVITIIRTEESEKVVLIAKALLSAGCPVMEVTSNTPNYLSIIKEIRTDFPSAIIGAGTITTALQAGEAISAGAMYLVTPITSKNVLDYALEMNIPVAMGAFSPTEIHNALDWGADFIKLFPADYLGPEYLKAVQATLPKVRFVPTGGVKINNVAAWMNAGASAFGLGGSILDKTMLRENDFEGISERAMKFKAEVDKY